MSSTAETKRIIQDFLFTATQGPEGPEAAFDKYCDEDYIQHNPRVSNGREGFIEFMTAVRACKNFSVIDKRLIVEDDMVFVHAEVTGFHWPDEPEPETKIAWADIFRIENGKIKEHWDLYQPIPNGPSKNGNPMV